MDFRFTDEQELLVDSIKEFCERYTSEEQIREMYEKHQMSEELLSAWMENGFGLMGIPEKYEGVDTDLVTLGILTEEFAHYSGCMLPTLNNALAMRDFIDFGASDDQINEAMASYMETGLPIFSLGFSEPGAGSDNQAMTCVTRKQADGTYLLSGQKTWVTQGEYFPNVLVIAKDEDPARDNRNMSMWVVPKDAPGLSTASLHKIGNQVAAFCEMYFDDVVLTEDMRIGEPGKGFFNLMKNFETERCLIVAQCIGTAQAAMDDAAAYVSERQTFGRPIADYQLIQLKLVEMETKLQNSRNMLYKTLWKMDNGESVRIDSALLKYYVAKACVEVASDAMQIYGGLGYTTETRLGRIWVDLRGMQIAGGTDEIMVYIAGRQLAKKYARS
ncbi:MAG: acyl-CoA dehydrogenase family protein [Eggerthellaceae bacterium]|nr:acyl-CoA dehydrogenase family protein [Eggerthellaceae bacterium]